MSAKKLNVTEARRQFCQIVAEQEVTGALQYIEVTHRGKPVVVIVGIDRFRELLRKAEAFDSLRGQELPEIEGSLRIVGDLEEGSQETARMIWDAVCRSSQQL
jgi:prevent-host-death family protein